MKTDFRVRKISRSSVLKIDHRHLTYGIAVVICLLLAVGMRAASAVGPSANPPAGAVTPNFSGLTVNGNVDVKGLIENPDGPLAINDKVIINSGLEIMGGGIMMNGGTLDVKGYIEDSAGDVIINDALRVNQKIYLPDGSGAEGFSLKYDTSKDKARADGDLVFWGNIDMGAVKYLNVSNAGIGMAESATKIVFQGPTETKENAQFNKNLNVSGDLGASGGLNVKGNIQNSAGAVTVNDPQGMLFAATPDVGPGGTATLRFGNTANWLGIDNNEIGSYGDKLYFQNDADQDVQIGSAAHTSGLQLYGDQDITGADPTLRVKSSVSGTGTMLHDNEIRSLGSQTLKVQASGAEGDRVEIGSITNGLSKLWLYSDDTVVGGNLSIGGKITADKIGSYFVRKQVREALGAGGYAKKTAACNSGEAIITCGLESYSGATGSTTSAAISLQGVHIDINGGSCSVAAHNPYIAARYYEPYAVCFDPGM